MTVGTNNELVKVQSYINKLQEIKEFLKSASAMQVEKRRMTDMRVNEYWQE